MTKKPLKEQIIDTALTLAERSSWEAVRLHDAARELDVTLDDVRAHFREKEDIVDAWFDRADAAMLHDAARTDFLKLSSRARLQRLMMTWFGALAVHRRPTRQMIYNKFEPGHIHYQLSGLFRVSRTVQWMREAAQRKAVLPWRAIEETVLTGIYLMTFFYWMQDDSENSTRTAAFLDRHLRRAEHCGQFLPHVCGRRRTKQPTPGGRSIPIA